LAAVGRLVGAMSDEATNESAANRNPRMSRIKIGR
jgi:hypothetical protein